MGQADLSSYEVAKLSEPGQFSLKFKIVRSGQFLVAPTINGQPISNRSSIVAVKPGKLFLSSSLAFLLFHSYSYSSFSFISPLPLVTPLSSPSSFPSSPVFSVSSS